MGSFVQGEGASLLAFGCFVRSYLHPAIALRHADTADVVKSTVQLHHFAESQEWHLSEHSMVSQYFFFTAIKTLYGNLVQMGYVLELYTRKNLSYSSSYLLVVVQSTTLDE
jgi:hypothetical protein